MNHSYLTILCGHLSMISKGSEPNEFLAEPTVKNGIVDANYEEIVFITSNIPDGNGYYPGVVQKFDVASKSWSTIFDCKVVDANK
ncbi:MAG: hypothetical protein ACK57V_19280 [Pirellula sp.]